MSSPEWTAERDCRRPRSTRAKPTRLVLGYSRPTRRELAGRSACARRGLERLSLPPRLRSMPLFGSPPALCCRTIGLPPAYSSPPLCWLAVISLLAARKALRVALLPLACTWLLLGLLLSEIEPAPDPQTQLSLIADAGGITAVDGEVTRTTPIRLTQSTLPFGNTTREEQSESLDRAGRFRGWPPRGRRPAGYSLRPYGSTIPCDPLRRPDPRSDRYARARALSRPRGVGCHRVAAPAGHRRGGLAQSLRPSR